MTSLTMTWLLQALLGVVASKVRVRCQSAGENGEYIALGSPEKDMAVRGVALVAVAGEYIGECRVGMLSFLSAAGFLAVPVALTGVGGKSEVGDLYSVKAAVFEEVFSFDACELLHGRLDNALGGGLGPTGVRAFRKSM